MCCVAFWCGVVCVCVEMVVRVCAVVCVVCLCVCTCGVVCCVYMWCVVLVLYVYMWCCVLCGLCLCVRVVWWCVWCGGACGGACGVAWCVVKLGTRKTPCVYVQNASVCTVRTSPCVPATGPHVFDMRASCRYTRRRPDRTHGGVLNVHTGGGFSSLSFSFFLSDTI